MSRRKVSGYAMLLEVLLGLTIFTLTVLFVMRLFPAADAAVGHSARVVQATQLARELLEGEMDKDYAAGNPVTPPGEGHVKTTSGQGEVTYASRRGSDLVLPYTYQVDVTQVGPIANLWNVKVTVAWSTGTGSSAVNRTVRLETDKGANW